MSKIGVHVVMGPRNGYGAFLRAIADAGRRLAIVKCVDALEPAREAKSLLPDTLTVGRINTVNRGGKHYDMQAIEPLQPDGTLKDTRQEAQTYYELVRPMWQAHRQWIDVWETFNEFSAHWGWQSDFFLAMMDLAEADGFRLAHYGCSTGNPPGVAEVFHMLPCLRAAKLRGHYLALHEYGGVGTDAFTLQGSSPYHALRYRHLYESILIPNQADPPLLITECGPNAGFQFPGTAALVEDMEWYDAELRRDAYVVGAAIFTLGNWANSNYQDALPALADLIVSTPATAPPPEPIGEPYVFGRPPIMDPAPSGPPGGRGQPRAQYTRIYLLLPNEPNTPEGNTRMKRWVQALVDSGSLVQYRLTMGFSADDAGLGDLDRRHVFAINPETWPDSLDDFFATHYPGTVYRPIQASTPEELLQAIRRQAIHA